MMTNERQRAEFEAWAARIGLCVTGKYAETINGLCAESAFKAGYKAALQSQDREDAERHRWLLDKFQQSYDGEDFESDSISIYSHMASQCRGNRTVKAELFWRDKTDEPIGLSEAIDHARRVEAGA